MADRPERPSTMTARERADALRRERLAEAMRANLKRRKEQQRERARTTPGTEPVEDG